MNLFKDSVITESQSLNTTLMNEINKDIDFTQFENISFNSKFGLGKNISGDFKTGNSAPKLNKIMDYAELGDTSNPNRKVRYYWCQIGNLVYYFGGQTPDQLTFFSNVEVYNIETDRWEKKNNCPWTICNNTMMGSATRCIHVNGKIYLQVLFVDGVLSPSLLIYDIEKDSWFKTNTNGGSVPFNKHAHYYNGIIYFCETDAVGHTVIRAYNIDTAIDEYVAYEFDTGSCSFIGVNNKLYIIGGTDSDKSTNTFIEIDLDIEYLEPITKLKNLEVMNKPRRWSNVIYYKNRIYVVGGLGSNIVSDPENSNGIDKYLYAEESFEFYDLSSGKWSDIYELNNYIYMAQSIIYKNYLFLLNGYGAVRSSSDFLDDSAISHLLNFAYFKIDLISMKDLSFKRSIYNVYGTMNSISYKNKIYFIGGSWRNKGTPTSSMVQIYDIKHNIWRMGAPKPTPTRYTIVAKYSGKIYCFGGYTGSIYISNIEIYDIGTDSWSSGGTTPVPFMNTQPVIYGDELYITNGHSSDTSFRKYNFVTNTWTTLTHPTGTRLMLNATVLYHDKIFTFGGTSDTTTYLNNCYMYDIALSKWFIKKNLPMSIRLMQTVVHGDKIYLISGYSGKWEGIMYVYDVNKDEYETKYIPFVGMVGANIIGNKIFCFGDYIAINSLYSKIFVYDIDNDSWMNFHDDIKIDFEDRPLPMSIEEYKSKLHNEISPNLVLDNVDLYKNFMDGKFVSDLIPNYKTSNFDITTTDTGGVSDRMYAPLVSDDRYIYIVHGYDNISVSYNNILIYDTTTKEYKVSSSDSSGRHSLTAHIHEGRIYTIGGNYNNNATIGIYDIATDTWRTANNSGSKNTRWHYSVLVDNKIYVIGGLYSVSGGTYEISNLVQVYDILTDTWENKSNMLTGARYPSGAYHNGKIYISGGEIGDYATPTSTRKTQIYDISSNTWKYGPDCDYTFIGQFAVVYGDKIYFNNGGISRICIFNTFSETWTYSSNYMTTVNGRWVDAYIINEKIYYIGGSIGSLNVQRYDINTNIISYINTSLIGRTHHNVGYINNKFYLFGGRTSETANNYTIQEIDMLDNYGVSILDPITNEYQYITIPSSDIKADASKINMNLNQNHLVITHNSNNVYNYLDINIKNSIKTSKTDIPFFYKGANHKAFYNNGKIYDNLLYTEDKQYETKREWEVISEMPFPAEDTTAQYYNKKIYVFGGLKNETATQSDRLNTLQIYDTITNTWDFGEPMPISLIHHKSVLYKDKIYIFAGTTYSSSSNKTYIYDILSNTWSTGANMPSAIHDFLCVEYNGVVYCLFGYDDSPSVTKNHFEYNIEANTWADYTSSKIAPVNQRSASGVLWGSYPEIFCFGGYDAVNTTFSHIYGYKNGVWYDEGTLPTAIGTANVVAYNDYIYLFGGWGYTNNDILWIYNPRNKEAVQFNTALYGAQEAGYCLGDGKFYVIGGKDSYCVIQKNVQCIDLRLYDKEFTIDNGIIKGFTLEDRSTYHKQTSYYHMNNTITNESYTICNDYYMSPYKDLMEPPVNPSSSTSQGMMSGENAIFGPTNQTGGISAYNYNIFTNRYSQLANPPELFFYAKPIFHNNKIYFIGGRNNTSPYIIQKLFIYDMITNTWSYGAPPLVRVDLIYPILYNNKIYVFGGRLSFDSTKSQCSKKAQIYDILSNTWSYGADLKTQRYEYVAKLQGDKIYIINGYTSSTTELNTISAINNIEIYNIANNTMIDKPSDSQFLHHNCALGEFRNTVIVDSDIQPPRVWNPNTCDMETRPYSITNNAHGIRFNDKNYIYYSVERTKGFRRFDMALMETLYNTKSSFMIGTYICLNTPEYAYLRNVLTGEFHFIEGVNLFKYKNSFAFIKDGTLNLIEVKDNIDLKFSYMGDKREDFSLADINLFHGGRVESNGEIFELSGAHLNVATLQTVKKYNIIKNTWETMNIAVPTAFYGACFGLYRDKIYLIGGTDASQLVQIYDIKNNSWLSGKNSPIEIRSFIPTNAIHTGKIYIVGGQNASNTLNTMYSYDIENDYWGEEPSLPFDLRWATYSIAGDRIYVFGSSHSENRINVIIYDIIEKKWSYSSPLEYNSQGCPCVIFDNQSYNFYGYCQITKNADKLKVFSIDDERWIKKIPLHADYTFDTPEVFLYKNKIYIIKTVMLNRNTPSTTFAIKGMQIYDPIIDTFSDHPFEIPYFEKVPVGSANNSEVKFL
ncbi:MAG: kelch repeat-containing protein [Herbinix sp.]|nr:kelch repeat-containing protein [Herbinix sp.]